MFVTYSSQWVDCSDGRRAFMAHIGRQATHIPLFCPFILLISANLAFLCCLWASHLYCFSYGDD